MFRLLLFSFIALDRVDNNSVFRTCQFQPTLYQEQTDYQVRHLLRNLKVLGCIFVEIVNAYL